MRASTLRAGLVLYGGLGRFADGGGSLLRPPAARALVPPLRLTGLRSAGRYVDDETNDARLTVAVARAAARAGARIATRVEVRALRLAGRARRRAPSARTSLGGAASGWTRPASSTRPGPWVDELRRMADPAAPRSLRFAKGAHLIVRLDEPWEAALTTPLEGGRVQFANPWEGALLVGTTDEPYEGDPARARGDDRRHRADRARVARRRSSPASSSTTASSRPSRACACCRRATARRRRRGARRSSSAAQSGHALDRRRQVHDVPPHRARRARAAARRSRVCARSTARPCRSRARPIRRSSSSGCCATIRACRQPSARHLARFHGSEALELLAAARDDPALLEPLAPGAPEVGAQVRWARRHEWALTRRRRPRPAHDAGRARARRGGAGARRGAARDERALRRRARPGHDEQPLPALRPRRGGPSRAAQHEHRQITPRPGWVEHDADEILQRSRDVHRRGARSGGRARVRPGRDRHRQPARDGRAVGARERAPARERDRLAGHAQRRARRRARRRSTASARRPACRSRPTSPAPSSRGCSTSCRARAPAPRPASWPPGTIDSWLAWHLAGVHVTDATNASRTLLMDLRTLDWDDGLLDAIGVPRALLAAIGPSSGVVGELGGMPLAALLGDQQAALFGQCCFAPGRGQVHLRHGQLPAAQHGRARRAVDPRADHGRRLPARRRRRPRTCSRARSR